MADDEAVKTVDQPEVVTKYKDAATIVNAALREVQTKLAPGASVVELCAAGDAFITAAVGKVYTKPVLVQDDKGGEKKKIIDKGVAFPTCISSNECVAHLSPLSTEDAALSEGDVVKVELGCHIDGFIAMAAVTATVGPGPGVPDIVKGRAADAMMAAWVAAEASLRLLRPGHTNQEITNVIHRAAAQYNCTPLEGVLSHQLKRYLIDGNEVVLAKPTIEQRVDLVKFEEHKVYAIDIAISTGEGKAREQKTRTTVFKRRAEVGYQLKMAAARKFLSEISGRGPDLPFTLRSMQDERKAKLGVTELITHQLVLPYPVLYEKEGEFVARICYTALVMPSQTLRITDVDKPSAQSEIELADEELKTLLATSTKKSKKKKKATPSAASAPMET